MVLVALIAAAKLISVVVAGNSAVAHFADGETAGLRDDVAAMSVLNVIESAKAPFAAGTLAVLDGRLEDADARFSEALARTTADESCPVRVNLELVRERQGDADAWERRPDEARERYTSALTVVEAAPAACFQGNTDPDEQRRAVREDTAARLEAKIAGLRAAPPPPAALPPPSPPPPIAPAVPQPEGPQAPLRLEPGTGDPIERLRQVLRDAAG